jgi:hypothetical protein
VDSREHRLMDKVLGRVCSKTAVLEREEDGFGFKKNRTESASIKRPSVVQFDSLRTVSTQNRNERPSITAC